MYDGSAAVWTESWDSPQPIVTGPGLDEGRLSFQAAGTGGGGRFEVERPFLVRRRAREHEPKEQASVMALEARSGETRGSPPPRPRAVWPFAAAIAMFAAEWIWRRRIGLR